MKIPEITQVLEAKINELSEKLKMDLDIKAYEIELTGFIHDILACQLVEAINEILSDEKFLFILSFIASQKGMSFVEKRPIKVLLFTGVEVKILSPYFYCPPERKAGRKKSGRKKGNNLDCHLGLSLMGFIGRYSPYIVQEVVTTSLSCPSFAVARELLAGRGIKLSVSAIEKLCINMAQLGLDNRSKISITRQENFTGLTLVVGTDGGRIRIRTTKRGKKKKGAKRQGYHTDWKEPKLLTIYLLDDKGNKVKSFPPIYDATMGNDVGVFNLIGEYLSELPLSELKNIVFCGDGAPWIWNRAENLLSELSDLKANIYQVLDYTHAKQALKTIWDLLPKKMSDKQKKRLWNQWKNELWNGNIDKLKGFIIKHLSKRQQKKGLKKWRDYFKKNEKRMQYSKFKKTGIICGSGCVESAIRRVINLRLKAPGSFWKVENAENFLFLRGQFISGRFAFFMNNLRNRIFYDLAKETEDIKMLKNNMKMAV
ncbi:MAG: hypothetical protein KAI79_20500 [Bacteroidales bacterium]|nr:hypothetical protein [Bacteroidales bacterium]